MLVPQIASEMAEMVTAHVDLSMMYVRERTGAFGRQHSSEELEGACRKHTKAIEAMRLQCCRLAEEAALDNCVGSASRQIRSAESKAFAELVHQIR